MPLYSAYPLALLFVASLKCAAEKPLPAHIDDDPETGSFTVDKAVDLFVQKAQEWQQYMHGAWLHPEGWLHSGVAAQWGCGTVCVVWCGAMTAMCKRCEAAAPAALLCASNSMPTRRRLLHVPFRKSAGQIIARTTPITNLQIGENCSEALRVLLEACACCVSIQQQCLLTKGHTAVTLARALLLCR